MNSDLIAGHDAVVEMRSQLVRDLKALVADSESLLKEVLNASDQEFDAVRTRVHDRLGEANARLVRVRGAACRRMGEATDITHEYVARNPWKALGAAAVLGLIIGAMSRCR